MNIKFISLANSSCTSCSHLVVEARQTFDTCHYTKGNTQCPAQNFRIGVGVNIEKASAAIAEALYAKDAQELAKHVNRLTKFHASQTSQVLEKAFTKTAELYGYEVEEEPYGDAPETVPPAEKAVTLTDAVTNTTVATNAPQDQESDVDVYHKVAEAPVQHTSPDLPDDNEDDDWKDDGQPSRS